MKLICGLLFCLCLFAPLISHPGHKHSAEEVASSLHEHSPESTSLKLLKWLGNWHLIFLHFPIALTFMTAYSEFRYYRESEEAYNQISRFMLNASAILAAPTVLFGLILFYASSYSPLENFLGYWHMSTGILATLLIYYASFLRKKAGLTKRYYLIFCLAFVLTNITGLLGGLITFGIESIFPI